MTDVNMLSDKNLAKDRVREPKAKEGYVFVDPWL